MLIRTLVPDPVSAESYRKMLVVKLFFRPTITLSDTPSISFNDLISTIASYVGLNIGSAESETKVTFISIHHTSNLHGVSFSDVFSKPFMVLD